MRKAFAAVGLAVMALFGCGNDKGTRTNNAAAEIEMLFVGGGRFAMGCTPDFLLDCFGPEGPMHTVTLDNYYIGKYEVTQKQWRDVMGTNPSCSIGDNLPLENVSWNDFQVFIDSLNRKTGKTYRLPTEAEWEYAAKVGGHNPFSELDNVAWNWYNSGGSTHEVGTKAANKLGIHDMFGNVWEFVNDRYGGYDSSDQTNPTGPSVGGYRVLRGGGFHNDISACKATEREAEFPYKSSCSWGFRLAMTP